MENTLLAFDRLQFAHLELTTRCNLRCVYCPQSQPFFDGTIDFPKDRLPSFIQELKASGVPMVRVSGIGETTVLEDWVAICEQLLQAGIDLEIVSNLSRRLDDEEIRMLSRFRKLYISCDTTDPDVFARIRRGARVEHVLEAIGRIAASARERGSAPPYMVASVVVTDASIFQIEKTLQDLAALGIQEMFINDLRQFPDVEGAQRVRPFWTLPAEENRRGRAMLERAVAVAREAGVMVCLSPGFSLNLERARKDPEAARANLSTGEAPLGSCTCSPGPGETKFCLDPWNDAFFRADATVSPCCVFPVSLGSVRDHTLLEVMEGPVATELRRQLLAGDLSSVCSTCNLKGNIKVEDMVQAVRTRQAMKKQGGLPALIDPRLADWVGRRLVIYGGGGHTWSLFRETRIDRVAPVAIVDKRAASIGKTLFGVPVHPPEALKALQPDLILISSYHFQEEIHRELEPWAARGVQIVRIYPQTDSGLAAGHAPA